MKLPEIGPHTRTRHLIVAMALAIFISIKQPHGATLVFDNILMILAALG